MSPNAKVTPNTIHTRRLVSSAHRRVLISVVTRISVPPIVGVPAFTRWVCGPSSRTTWPTWWYDRRSISHGPRSNDRPSAETVARMARNVRYEKTLKPECQATKCCESQYSINVFSYLTFRAD